MTNGRKTDTWRIRKKDRETFYRQFLLKSELNNLVKREKKVD